MAPIINPVDALLQFKPKEKSQSQITCESKGGTWDEVNKTCTLPDLPEKPSPVPVQEQPPKVDAAGVETFSGQGTLRATGATIPGLSGKDGPVTSRINKETGEELPLGNIPQDKTFLGLSPEEVNLLAQQQAGIAARPEGTAPVGTAQRRSDLAFQGQQLAGQVGQFGQLGVDPTGLDVGQAAIAGVRDAIPRALTLAGGAAVAGATAGLATGGVASVPLAVAAAAVTFVGSITASMISNFKSQRTDTTTAQQRVLDEGKQTMNDWATAAKNDPSNRMFYLSQFNKQSAQIDQAHRQMKLDTSRDLAKFETAIPNLAEFNSFYSAGGERDELNEAMRIALLAPAPEGYDMLELTNRRLGGA